VIPPPLPSSPQHFDPNLLREEIAELLADLPTEIQKGNAEDNTIKPPSTSNSGLNTPHSVR
jgi:hypothetical protein